MIYDISVPVSADLPVYPGDPTLSVKRVAEIARGDPYTLSAVSLGVHLGTHVDAPAHFFPGGDTVDRLPLDALVGPATLVDLSEIDVPASIGLADLRRLCPAEVPDRLLFKTRNTALWSRYPGRFAPAWVGLTSEAAVWAAQRGVRLVGIDYMSIEPPEAEDFATHRALLSGGVVVLEGLDFTGVPAGRYHLTVLPLRLVGVEAAPARAILNDRLP